MSTYTNTAFASSMPAPITAVSAGQKAARMGGLFYLLSFVSIPTLSLYSAVHEPNYITGHGPDTAVFVGVVLEMIVALAGIGTAVSLFPVLKRKHEGMALGFVGSHILEAATILAGVAFLLAVVSLRQSGVGPEALTSGRVLVILYDRVFLMGQSLMPAVNGLLLGTLLYKSKLLPRILPVLGLAGSAILVAANMAVLFGFIEQHAPSTGLAAVPIALWEFSLGIYLLAKGFRPGPLQALM
jgi:hypothetical protein